MSLFEHASVGGLLTYATHRFSAVTAVPASADPRDARLLDDTIGSPASNPQRTLAPLQAPMLCRRGLRPRQDGPHRNHAPQAKCHFAQPFSLPGQSILRRVIAPIGGQLRGSAPRMPTPSPCKSTCFLHLSKTTLPTTSKGYPSPLATGVPWMPLHERSRHFPNVPRRLHPLRRSDGRQPNSGTPAAYRRTAATTRCEWRPRRQLSPQQR